MDLSAAKRDLIVWMESDIFKETVTLKSVLNIKDWLTYIKMKAREIKKTTAEEEAVDEVKEFLWSKCQVKDEMEADPQAPGSHEIPLAGQFSTTSEKNIKDKYNVRPEIVMDLIAHLKVVLSEALPILPPQEQKYNIMALYCYAKTPEGLKDIYF